MRIVAILSVYNEEELLPECLKSLEGKVDYTVIVDGAYIGFDGNNTHSTDKTIEIIDKWMFDNHNSELFLAREWHNAGEKYQMALHCGQDGDWFMIVDADDRIDMTDQEWKELRKFLSDLPEEYMVATGDLIHPDGSNLLFRRKLIRWRKDVHIGKNHWTFVDANEKPIDDGDSVVITSLRFKRVAHLRTPERENLKRSYNTNVRYNYEKP